MKFLLFITVFFISTTSYNQRIDEISPNRYRFKHRSKVFKGSKIEITTQLRTIKNSPKFSGIPQEIQVELNRLFNNTKSQVFPKRYRKKAIRFLNALYRYEDFVIMYNSALYDVIEKLKRDMKRIDFKLEKQFIRAKTLVDRAKKKEVVDMKEVKHLADEMQKSLTRLACHRWMKKKFDSYKGINVVQNPVRLIEEFKKQEAAYIFSIFEKKEVSEIKLYLENEIIDFYYKKALKEITPEQLELFHINKYN